jgi:hypothetical protein
MLGAKPLQRLQASEARHRDVENDDIGRVLFDLLQDLSTVAGFTRDLQILLGLEKSAQSLANNSMVVGYEY